MFPFLRRKSPRVMLTALDGVEQVGARNCYAIKTRDKTREWMLMLDCGQGLNPLPGRLLDEDRTNISYPDFTYLESETTDIPLKWILLSHGHMDHYAAVPKIWRLRPERNPTIIGSELTLRALARLEDAKNIPYQRHTVVAGETFYFLGGKMMRDWADNTDNSLQPDATVYALSVPHSVPESLGFLITIGKTRVLYLGDFKINGLTPQETERFRADLVEIGKAGVDALMLEATNVCEDGYTPSETIVWEELDRIIANAKGRVILATFSSHLSRLRTTIKLANEYGRPVFVSGRAMRSMLEAYGVTGWTALKETRQYRFPYGAVILTSGCQAEENSGLVRAVYGEGAFSIWKTDTVVMAADPIPLPEIIERVNELVALLAERAGTVYINTDAELPGPFRGNVQRARVHVSGHGKRGDLLEVLKTVNPGTAIPIHADRERREALAKLAEELGMKSVLLETGVPVTLSS